MAVWQERTASPSRWTVHAPHWAIPQPNLVPVRPSVSRSTQRSGVSGVTLTVSRLPLTVKLIGGMSVVLITGEDQTTGHESLPDGGPGAAPFIYMCGAPGGAGAS